MAFCVMSSAVHIQTDPALGVAQRSRNKNDATADEAHEGADHGVTEEDERKITTTFPAYFSRIFKKICLSFILPARSRFS